MAKGRISNIVCLVRAKFCIQCRPFEACLVALASLERLRRTPYSWLLFPDFVCGRVQLAKEVTIPKHLCNVLNQLGHIIFVTQIRRPAGGLDGLDKVARHRSPRRFELLLGLLYEFKVVVRHDYSFRSSWG